MPYFTKDDVNLYYEYQPASNASDETETIILIHGLAFDLRTWDRMIPFMGNYHILRYDFRGHGLSSTGNEPFNDVNFVDDLFSIMTLLSIQKAHVIAHGAGALIALYFTKCYPNMVQSSVLLSIPLFLNEDSVNKYTSYRKSFSSIQALADHVLSYATLFQKGTPELNKLYESYFRTTVDVYYELIDYFLHHHLQIKAMFKEQRIPLLFLTGEKDVMYPTYLSSLIASANPVCRYMTIYDASNMVFYDQPEETFRQIQKFWNSYSQHSEEIQADPLLQHLHADFFQLRESQELKADATLTVNLIGRFDVLIDDVHVSYGWGRRYAKDLLIYLLFNPSVSREQLCADIFGEMDIAKAKGQLRVCLVHLKKLLNNDGNQFLFIDKKQVALRGNVQSDLQIMLNGLVQATNEKAQPIKFDAVQKIFQNATPAMFIHLNQDWSLHIRTKAEIQLLYLAKELAAYLLSRGELTEAITYFKYALMFNEDDAAILQQIANLYEQANHQAEAIKWRERARES